jgi:type IV secretion system protein VirD4
MSDLDLYQLPTSTRGRRLRGYGALALSVLATAAAALSVGASRLVFLLGDPAFLGPPSLPPIPRAAAVAGAVLFALWIVASVRRRAFRWLSAVPLLGCGLYFFSRHAVYPPRLFLFLRPRLVESPWSTAVSDATWHGLLGGLVVGLALLPALPLWGLRRAGDVHGSARFANASDLRQRGFLFDSPAAPLQPTTALPLGFFRQSGRFWLLRMESDQHLLIFAASGAGKTTAFVVPFVQDYADCSVVVDVKGEISAATAGVRAARGSDILYLNPATLDPMFARYNPLLCIRKHPYDVQDAQLLAGIFCPKPPHESASFWRLQAKQTLEAFFLHVLYAHPSKTLATCLRLLAGVAGEGTSLNDVLEVMRTTPHDPEASLGWTLPDDQTPTRVHPHVLAVASNLLTMNPETRSGVIAEAMNALANYADPILAQASATSDFSPEDLYLHRERPVTLYLRVNPNDIQRLSTHLRVVVAQLLSAMSRQPPSEVHRRRVLFVIDEFPVFGNLTVLHDAIAYLRGYGVQVVLVVQDIGQIHRHYGREEGITPNCATQVAFATSHLPTAEHLSKAAGRRTVAFERTSHQSRSMSSSVQDADAGRMLLDPAEVLRLPRDRALLFRAGCHPALIEPVGFYREPRRTAAAAIPPPAVSARLTPAGAHWEGLVVDAPRPARRGSRETRTVTKTHLLGPRP